jgi:hypothetical protein
MAPTQYTATKSLGEGRSVWTVAFRHPLLADSEGNPGKKVRKSLKTDVETRADELLEQLNGLLADPRLHSLSARSLAERKGVDPLVLSLFYDSIHTDLGQSPTHRFRESQLPLPTIDDGYLLLRLAGQTGAGKSTLMRELMGTTNAHFPATSGGRCTTSKMEVILADEPQYRAAVTFHPEALVRTNVQECIFSACRAARAGKPDADIADALLRHPEGHFSLKYTLGAWKDAGSDEGEDEWSFGSADDEDEVEDPRVDAVDLEQIQTYVLGVRKLTEDGLTRLRQELGAEAEQVHQGREQETLEQWFLEAVELQPGFTALVDNVLSGVQERLTDVPGKLHRQTSGWPIGLTYASSDRKEFLRFMRRFFGISASQWGQLLTPLVDGVRMRGRFRPSHVGDGEALPRWILVDGEGLGHRTHTIGSLPEEVGRDLARADVVLLVDSAMPAMLDAPLSILKGILAQGHQDKVALIFSHFDKVTGPNLQSADDRRRHVLGAVRNALGTLRQRIDPALVHSFEEEFEERSFFFVRPEKGKGLAAPVKKQLRALQAFIEHVAARNPEPTATPRYHREGLTLAVQRAATEFLGLWSARLGYGRRDGVSPAHWAEVWALDRRVVQRTQNHYRHLRPVEELHGSLIDSLSRFVSNPAGWDEQEPTAESKRQAINGVRTAISGHLWGMVQRRLIDDRLNIWIQGVERSGVGSGRARFQDVRRVIEGAVLVPQVDLSDEAREFLHEVEREVRAAVIDAGGNLL